MHLDSLYESNDIYPSFHKTFLKLLFVWILAIGIAMPKSYPKVYQYVLKKNKVPQNTEGNFSFEISHFGASLNCFCSASIRFLNTLMLVCLDIAQYTFNLFHCFLFCKNGYHSWFMIALIATRLSAKLGNKTKLQSNHSQNCSHFCDRTFSMDTKGLLNPASEGNQYIL